MALETILSVSDFVAVFNQTLEYAYPSVTITGELANFRVSKNRWVYFDLKDEQASVKFFGTVYQLPGPLEDGMALAVRGMPRLHSLYGFSISVQIMAPTGQGSIKKAAQLLEAKLRGEGLFDEARKRQLPYPPRHIGLITSAESAAYRDFIKVLQARWGGADITLIDVQVQGESSPAQIMQAIEQFNQLAVPPDVLVITRGGGSAEDLQAFSTEQVTRAVSASRIPTLVAIGHEVDWSLAELAADQRASTPSNAAELLVPDRRELQAQLSRLRQQLAHLATAVMRTTRKELVRHQAVLSDAAREAVRGAQQRLLLKQQVLTAYNPQAALARGYALLRKGGVVVREACQVQANDDLVIEITDATLTAIVKSVTIQTNYGDKGKRLPDTQPGT